MTRFADLHRGPGPLLLPNAWDVASALTFVAAGFSPIGTTSFGVASSLGALPILLTVDIEDGYSDDPAEVAAWSRRAASPPRSARSSATPPTSS